MTNKRIPDTPPIIQPVSDAAYRPRWSVMIPIYNNTIFLQEAIESVLHQDPGESQMQIEVVDDCTDEADVRSIVEKTGKGRVGYFRQSQNLGSLRNFETCLNRAKGSLIHLLHSDDMVKPGFYFNIERLFELYPQAGAAFSNYTTIDEKGKILYENDALTKSETLLDNFSYIIAHKCPVQYVSMVVKREVYEQCGGFYGREYGEDWEMWGRIASKFPVAYTPQSLANYRVHLKSITGRSFRTGQNFREISHVVEILSGYLPKEKRAQTIQKAKRHYAWYSLFFADYIWSVTRNKKALFAQVTGALKMYSDSKMILKATKLYSKLLFQPVVDLIKKKPRN